jgi:hypothetical protein
MRTIRNVFVTAMLFAFDKVTVMKPVLLGEFEKITIRIRQKQSGDDR